MLSKPSQDEIEKYGEDATIRFLQSYGLEINRRRFFGKITRVRDIDTQFEGRDFWVLTEYGKISVEAKGEWKHTGNVALEHVSNAHTNRPGWMVTAQADSIAFVFMKEQVGYYMDLNALRDFWRSAKDHWPIKEPHLDQPNLTQFYCAPIAEIMREIYVEKFNAETGIIINA